jgi:hypothetical protein
MIHHDSEIGMAAVVAGPDVDDDVDGNLRLESLVQQQQLQQPKHKKLLLLDNNDSSNVTIATTEDVSSSSWGSSSKEALVTQGPQHQQQQQQPQQQQQFRHHHHRVQLPDDDDDFSGNNRSSSNHGVAVIHHNDPMEPWSDEELYAYFIQPEDVKRFELDVKTTIQQWVNYKKGNIVHFDEDVYTMRGLEEAMDHLRCCCKNNNNSNNNNNMPPCSSSSTTIRQRTNNSRHELKIMHTKGVLEEVERQKKKRNNHNNNDNNNTLDDDAEELRLVSERLSECARQQAIRTAEMDQLAVRNVLQQDNKLQQLENNMASLFRRQSEPVAAPTTKKKIILQQPTIKSCDHSAVTANTATPAKDDSKKRRKSIFSFIKINKKDR